MTKLRLATYLTAAGLLVVGFVVPLPEEGKMAIIAAGMGLLGLATRWPQDQSPPPPPSDATRASTVHRND